MRLSAVLCCIILFYALPAHVAASRTVSPSSTATTAEAPTAANHCEQILGPSFKTFDEVRSYLNNHMLFGPEVTFSSARLSQTNGLRYTRVNINAPRTTHFATPDWTAIKTHIQTHVPNYPKGALNDVLRFFQNVFDVTAVTIHLDPPSLISNSDYMEHDGVTLHKQNVLFLLQIKGHRNPWVSVTLEPTCLEVNFPPQKYQDIHATWQPIFAKALDAGFYGYNGFATGGGGGHIHVGFDTAASNLFLSRPNLLADYLLFPLIGNGIMPMLCAQNDHGRCGNIRTPMDVMTIWNDLTKDSKKTLHLVTMLDGFLRDHDRGKRSLLSDMNEFHILAKKASLVDHHSYVSLKRFFEETNPRIELRHFRASNSFEDLSAALSFVYHMAVFSLANNERYDVKQLYKASERSMYKHRLQFEALLSGLSLLGLSNEHKQQLLHFGGDTLPQQLTLRTQGPGLKHTRGWLEISATNHPFHHAISIPLTVDAAQNLKQVSIQSSNIPAGSIEYGLHSTTPHPTIIIYNGDIDPFSSSRLTIELLDAANAPLDSFTIHYKPLVPRPANATDFAITMRHTTADDRKTITAAVHTGEEPPVNWQHIISFAKTENGLTNNPYGLQLLIDENTIDRTFLMTAPGLRWTETATTYEVLLTRSIAEYFYGSGKSLYLVDLNGDSIAKPIYFSTPEEAAAAAAADTQIEAAD